MSIVREAFDKHARVERKAFQKGRDKSVGSSEIGQCIRKIGYVKHGEPDEGFIDNWGAAKRGSVFESRFFLPAMRKQYGDNLLYAGTEQKRLIDGMLSATPDGLLVKQPRNLLAGLMVPDIGPDRSVIVECKSIDPRINLSEPKSEHVFQVIVQLGLMRKLTKHKPLYGIIIYTNASFFDDTVEFVIKFDEAVFENARKRATSIMQASTAADLSPEGWIAGGDECRYCGYAKSCRALRGGVPQNDKVNKPDPQFLAEMIDLAQEERAAAEAAEAWKREQRTVQEKIKQRLKEKGLSSVKDSGISIIWSAVKGRPSYDMPGIKAAAKAAGVDLQRFETVGEPSDRLVISVSKQDRLVKRNN